MNGSHIEAIAHALNGGLFESLDLKRGDGEWLATLIGDGSWRNAQGVGPTVHDALHDLVYGAGDNGLREVSCAEKKRLSAGLEELGAAWDAWAGLHL